MMWAANRIAGRQLESLIADCDHVLALDDVEDAEQFILCERQVFRQSASGTICILYREHGTAGMSRRHLEIDRTDAQRPVHSTAIRSRTDL